MKRLVTKYPQHIDDLVTSVAQAPRRIPFYIRKAVQAKLDELETLGIIEPVKGPTPWVSPLVAVPKPNGDIRICVDMHQANSAIVCERHPIPIVEETLQELHGATIFFLSWTYVQTTIKSSFTPNLDQSPPLQLRMVCTSIHN